MMRVACVGEAMIELSIQGGDAVVGVAGDTMNTAVYLKRTAPQLAVDYVTCVGDDPFSTKISSFIGDQNLGTDAIRKIPGKSPGLYAITTADSGERSFTYWRNASAARDLFQKNGAHDFAFLAEYDWVYLSGISVAILPHAVRMDLLAWLEKSSVKIAFDSNYRPRLWENAATARHVIRAFWERSDLLLPSMDDEQDLSCETDVEVTARFGALGKPGALKRGALGPFSLGQVVEQSYPAARHVVDTTAAGDSFNGGYLGAILSGATQAEALMSGHRLAARVVQHRGAIIPDQASA